MQKAVTLIMVLFLSLSWRVVANGQEQNKTHSNQDIWSELMQRMPYPHALPLHPPKATSIDGTYAKFKKRECEPVHCLRCPDYAPEGGIRKLYLSKGAFRIFHQVTGWKEIGSFYISGDPPILANDPVCHELIGVYRWKMEEGKLIFNVIEDKCAIA